MPKHRSRLRQALYATIFVLLSACGGKSCSCVSPIKGGFPVAKRHENAIQVRATASAFDFLSKNGPTLIPGIIGGNMFTIPPSCGGSTPICCAMPNQVCQLSFDFKTLSLTPTAPSSIHLSTDLVVKTVMDLPVTIPVVGACNISIDTTLGSPQTLNATADLTFAVDKTSDTTALSASNASVTVQDAAIGISGGILCTGLSLFKPIVVTVLQGVIAGQLQTLIGGVACQACTTQDDCNSFATACTGGKCVEADGTTCVPSLGLEGNVDIASLLASFAPSLKANMDFLAVTGGYAGADTGLSLGLLGGAQGDPHNACVPVTTPPAVPTVAQSPTFLSDLLPDKKTPYHLGIGIHVSELNTIGWGAFDSGALCLQVGTKQVSLLSSSTIGLIIPSLSDITHSGNAPMYLQLKPAAAPVFTLGKGTFGTDPSGQTIVVDPLLNVGLPGLSIDFYAFVDERFVRVLTLTADVTLPLSLAVDPVAGTISPLFGKLDSAFQNVVVTNSELLAETPDDLAKAFPALLSVAVGQIVGSLKNIALPAIAGLQISPIAITSTDPNTTGVAQFLAIFANLASATTAIRPAALPHYQARATLTKVEVPPTREFAVTARGTTQPTAHIAVAAAGPGPFEFDWSLDGGPWSPFTAGDELVVRDPVLWLQGRHNVDVRARVVGQPATLGAATSLPLIIDSIAPTGRLDVAGGELVVNDAGDNVSPPSALQLRFAVTNGAFGEWATTTRATLPAGVSADQLHVQLRDEAGNTTDLTQASGSAGQAGGGCSVGGHGSDGSLVALLLVGLALVVRRRRGAISSVVVVALGLGCVSGCSNHPLGKGDFANPADEIGRYSAVVVDKSGTLHISAYDDSFGDLVYTTVTTKQISATPSWQVIDGVDISTVPEMKGGYRFGITDPGDDVGQYTSLALTGSGSPRIAYYDATNHALKFAVGPHPFKTYAVDSGSGVEQVGMYAALSLDKHDVPSIAYVATNLADGDGFKSELRVATAKSSHPTSAGDWTISVADTSPITCAGLCAATDACITPAMVNGVANTDPSLSTCIQIVAGACATACSSTQACINAACTTFLPAVAAPDLIEGTGLFVNALRNAAGNLVLVYYDKEEGDLKLATQSGASWSSVYLDGPDATTDVGQFTTAAFAGDDTLHVSYVDATNGTLLYKQVPSGAAAPAMAEVVDDGSRGGTQHAVGAGANLVLDGTTPRVVYQDQTLSDLEMATRASAWSHSDLQTGSAGFGFYPHQVLAGGKLYLAQFVYDRSNPIGSPLGKLELSVSAP
jgi:MYXO-CTERM domain-containing protein